MVRPWVVVAQYNMARSLAIAIQVARDYSCSSCFLLYLVAVSKLGQVRDPRLGSG